jgi:phage-related protein
VSDKPLVWLGSSRIDVRTFPALVRRLTGFQLRRTQQGLDPDDWKPMPSVGPGVREIRIHTEGAYRVFYVAAFEEAIYVLHSFEKKTRKTAARHLEIGRQRFRALVQMRQHEKKRNR